MSEIKTVSISNNQQKFETEVNELLAGGYVVLSCNCSAYGYDGNIDEIWLAILLKNDSQEEIAQRGK